MPFKRKELKIKGANLWYLIGLITSDGCLSVDGRHIDITSSDYEFLQQIKDLIGISSKIGTKYNTKKQRSFRIQIANKNFYDFLLSVGLLPKKSLILKELAIPHEFFRDFLRGLIDGDGGILRWIHHTNLREQWSLRISSGSRKFLEWLNKKIESIFKAKGKIYQENIQGTQFILKYGKITAKRILENCYYSGCVGLKRKLKLARACVSSFSGWKTSKTLGDFGRVVERYTRQT